METSLAVIGSLFADVRKLKRFSIHLNHRVSGHAAQSVDLVGVDVVGLSQSACDTSQSQSVLFHEAGAGRKPVALKRGGLADLRAFDWTAYWAAEWALVQAAQKTEEARRLPRNHWQFPVGAT
ncbi:hypothetical protein [Celeribacter sp.]|uniref:hypothetical protein n=1 Tax=Celeribacter sp. TaxID=1890673 RepID=UPI003A8DCFDF